MEAPLPVGCYARVEAVRPPAVCEKHYGHCLQLDVLVRVLALQLLEATDQL